MLVLQSWDGLCDLNVQKKKWIQGEGKGEVVTGKLMILSEVSRNSGAFKEKNWLI